MAKSESITKIGVFEFDTQALRDFIEKINREPDKKSVKSRKDCPKVKYLPIGVVEKALNDVFFGIWNTRNFNTQVIANEIVGSIELTIIHPVLKCEICRIGAAGVQIRYNAPPAGQKQDITQIQNKITNALVMDYPHLKAACISNAAKAFGEWFGAALNRDDDYYDLIDQPETVEATAEPAQQTATGKTVETAKAKELTERELLINECLELLEKATGAEPIRLRPIIKAEINTYAVERLNNVKKFLLNNK